MNAKGMGGGVILIDRIFPIAIMLTWLKRHNGIHALCKWNLAFTFWSFLSIVGNGLHVHMYISFRNCGNSNCNKICSKKILLTKIGFHSMVFVKKTVGLSKINPYRKELEKIVTFRSTLLSLDLWSRHSSRKMRKSHFYHIRVIQFRITFTTRNLVNERSAHCKEFCWKVLSFFFKRSYGTTDDNNVDKRI